MIREVPARESVREQLTQIRKRGGSDEGYIDHYSDAGRDQAIQIFWADVVELQRREAVLRALLPSDPLLPENGSRPWLGLVSKEADEAAEEDAPAYQLTAADLELQP